MHIHNTELTAISLCVKIVLAGAWESWVVKALPATVVMIFLGVGTTGLIAPTLKKEKAQGRN